MINPQLAQAIQAEIAQCQEEGQDEDDIKWMAVGAGIRFGREQGVIGDPVETEMQAAIQAVVEQEVKKG